MMTFDDTVDELLSFADDNDASDDALDAVVLDVADKIASDINNGGLEKQLKFLLVHLGLSEETVNTLKKELNSKKDDAPDAETTLGEHVLNLLQL